MGSSRQITTRDGVEIERRQAGRRTRSKRSHSYIASYLAHCTMQRAITVIHTTAI